jgi:molecular chaperone GrpE
MKKEKNNVHDASASDPVVSPAGNDEDVANEPAASETASSQPEPETPPANGEAMPEAEPLLSELEHRFLRLAADFANYTRRNEAERAEIADWARRDFALALLPILDDFSLMIEYETQHPERLAEGAKMIRQKMLEFLGKQGLEKIEALNQPYDYERHEAVLAQPVQDKALDHSVLSVMQDGYLYKDKVLRPAKVIVGQYAENKENAINSLSSLESGQTEKNDTEPN